MATYRIDLAYLGTGFHGYAAQPNVRTVQGELEAAIARVLGPVETFVAGRTDKGVHASGQVVSFSTDGAVEPSRLQRSLNKQLGPEVAVSELRQVDDGFHARFSATGRRYVYKILNRTAPDPFLAHVSWHYTTPLDLAAMNDGCAALVGKHDFASLCRAAAGKSTVRDLRRVHWSEDGDMRLLEVAASSFCHQMVRSIVALSVEVGRGKLESAAVGDVLAAQDRNAGFGAAPPHGLTLVEVTYG